MSHTASFMQTGTLQQGSARQARQILAAQESVRSKTAAFAAHAQCSISGTPLRSPKRGSRASKQAKSLVVFAVKNGATLDRPLRVAVVGGGPAGACTAETLAKGGIETYLFERKMDNCKVSIDQTFGHQLRKVQL